MHRLLIKNGRIIDPATGYDGTGDVLVEGDRISQIGQTITVAGAEIFDASGLVVAPGFIDMHVHLREPGFEHAETIETGTRAAAAGGFTSVCCMPNTCPVNDNPTVTSYIIERSRRLAAVNVFPIGAITRGLKGEELAAIGSMKRAGIVAISDDGQPVMNARLMRRAMELAKAFDLPVIQHCEDLNLSAGGVMHEGLQAVRLGLRGIPACAEDVMVARDLILAELTGAHYHVAHISTKNSVAMVAYAKAQGISVTCEVTPHHLTLTDECLTTYNSNYKMKPPLRSPDHVEALVNGVVAGTIDVIATDHAPHPGSEKMQEFERCPFGVIGLETAVAVCLERLVHCGRISLKRFIELFTLAPARILRLDRGTLRPGSIADITILDLETEWTYDVNKSYSKSRNTPFDGRTFRGGPVATIVAGKIVWTRDKGVV